MSQQRKVLFLSPAHETKGGVESSLDLFQANFSKQGWEVIVGLAKGARFHDPDRFKAEHPNLKTIEINGSSGYRSQRIQSILDVIRRIQPDVVVPLRLFDAFEAAAIGKMRGDRFRLLATIRGCASPYFEDLRVYAPFIDFAVGGNRLISKIIHSWCRIDTQRIETIPAPMDPPEVFTSRRDLNDVFQIGYVGRLEENEKRVTDIIALCERLDALSMNYQFHIVGTGPEEERLKLALVKQQENARVVFHGWQSKDQLYNKIYPSLHVCMLFSPSEAVPITLREAMHFGCVPVTSAFRGVYSEGLFEHGSNAMIFPIGDLSAAKDALLKLSKNAVLWEQLSNQARGALNPNYYLDDCMKTWVQSLNHSLESEIACGKRLPDLELPSGRLDAIGLPKSVSSFLRYLLGSEVMHQDPGGEWPHTGPWASNVLSQIDALAESLEGSAVQTI